MRIWNNMFLVCLLAFVLTGCGSARKASELLHNQGLMGKLANADLSAKGPAQPNRRLAANTRGDHRPGRYEKYPGDDNAGLATPKFEGLAQSSNGYELNFNNAELSELAKVVLQDTLEVPYIYDPRVQGRVTVSTGRPVARDKLLSILETVLAMHQGALIRDGDTYRIVPANEPRLLGQGTVDYVKEQKAAGPGYGISIFPLKYISSETMLRALSSLVSRTKLLRASFHDEILIVRGSGQERQRVLEIAVMFDVDWMKGQSVGIYVLKNVSPGEIIEELDQVFRTKGRGAGLVRFRQIERLNAVLALTNNSEMLDRVAVWVRRLDRTGTEGNNYYVYRVENGKAKELAEILNQTFAGGDGVVRKPEESDVSPAETASNVSSQTSAASNAALPGSSTLAAPGLTASASRSARAGAIPAGHVRVIPDEVNNKLLIRASGREYRQILNILRRIDQPPLQVLINATLAEVTLNDNLQYGVQFFLTKDDGRNGALGFTKGTTIEIGPTVPGLNFIIGSTTNPKVVLDALASETKVNVVSSPSVVVLHNQIATLQVGDEVPIATRQVSSVTDADAPLINEIKFRNTGVILNVTPRVNSNGLVTMEVEQEISAVTSTTAVGDTGTLTPTISQRRIKSTIAVHSGQLVVLGGLISEQTNNDKSRLPLIRRIPGIGNVIGNTTKSKARTELIVFLQPLVIRNAEDASRIAQDLRSSMQSLAPPLAEPPLEGHGTKDYKKAVRLK